MLDWHVAIYGANEAARLALCLQSVVTALHGSDAVVSVILNGTHDTSILIAREFARRHDFIHVHRIAHGDKSNAINQFYHSIRQTARAYAGVDAYVRVGPHAFRAMAERLAADPHAMAISGVAINGRTMRQATGQTLSVGGQLHGQLHALRPDFLDRMVAQHIRLPVGLYRGDGLLASMAAHNLDATGTAWDNSRIPGVAEAQYEIPVLSPLRAQDLRRQYRRKIRQIRGRIEAEAIKQIIYRDGYAALPDNADDMIRAYLANHAPPRSAIPDRIFQILAIRASTTATRPPCEDLQAHEIRLI